MRPLRQLEKIQERTTENTAVTQEDPSSGLLHRDGAYGVVDINDQLVRLRIPDPDYVLIFCAVAAPVRSSPQQRTRTTYVLRCRSQDAR